MIKGESYVYEVLIDRIKKIRGLPDLKWRIKGPSRWPTFNFGRKTISVKFAEFNDKAKKWTWNLKDIKNTTFVVCIAIFPEKEGSDAYVFPRRMLKNVLHMSYRQFERERYAHFRENWEIITGGPPKKRVGRPTKYHDYQPKEDWDYKKKLKGQYYKK